MPDKNRTYISVMLPLLLEWEPYYWCDSEVEVGTRVSVRFAGRSYVGVVSNVGVVPKIGIDKILPVISVMRGLAPVSEVELKLWRFVSEYYLCTVGEVYKAAYPALKIGVEMSAAREDERRRLAVERRKASVVSMIARLDAGIAGKQEAAAKSRKDSTREKYLSAAGRLEARRSVLKEELARLDAAGETPVSGRSMLPDNAGFSLSSVQREAYGKIQDAFSGHEPVLLEGVTGSGKTEIYASLAMEALKRGKNVLYLVPEIAVSRQLEERLGRIFGPLLRAFHSKETASVRQRIASEVRSGRYVVLGTRSALFLPHHDLGLIIVDEEHDTSYKQDAPAPRYNGRDTALMLARICGADIILGTATPSLESLYNCRTGRMAKIELKERYFGSSDSDVEIIDTAAERRKHGMSGNFSFKLISLIRAALASGGQVLVLRARRAYSPAVQCSSCGDIPRCPHCNVPLSWHRDEGILLCHYCGWRTPYDGVCGKCGAPLVPLGAGTQRIEEEARELFPEARIARLDSDTAMSAANEAAVIRDFAAKKTDILIGTQIITKGFDFDGLSLVAVLQADSLLGQQDFRADEHAVQLLEQFRGRSGRRNSKGCLVIQTAHPEHPVYKVLGQEGSRSGLVEQMMEERFAFGYPPFSRIVKIIVKDSDEARAEKLSADLASSVRAAFGPGRLQILAGPSAKVTVTGPYAPPVDRQSDMYIRHIRVSLKKDSELAENKRKLADTVWKFAGKNKCAGRIALDVDPV